MSNSKGEILPKSQLQLIWGQFKRHRLAWISLFILIFFYVAGVLFPGFFAPYTSLKTVGRINKPPQIVRFIDEEGNFYLRPFVYNLEAEVDSYTFEVTYKTGERLPIYFFIRGEQYTILKYFESNLHLFGTGKDEYFISLMGSDDLGRDLFSRTVYASQVSLTIGFAGVLLSLFFGLFFGGISGLFGGLIDDVIQRIIEILMVIPKIPFWMALAAALPKEWSPLQIYFAITMILALIGWTGLARVVRSKFISTREEDFVSAAISYNTPMITIIFRHLIPNFISYIIVNITLAIPAMILAETSLSFLGIGLRPPIVSLGVLLNRAQKFQTVSMYPWLMFPGLIIIIVVLAFNFVGDGLRDAADPYS